MRYEILAKPAASVVKIHLQRGESFTCEVGAMVAMSTRVTVETTSKSKGGTGGLLQGLKRMFSGENIFLNHFTSQADDQYIILGPSFMGDIIHHSLQGGALIVQGGSWLASEANIGIDTTFQGLGKAFFSGEGAFWVKCTGNGSVFLNSYGAIYPVEINGSYIVDTGHIVAFEDTLQFSIQKAGASLIGSFLGGEGLVCRFEGRGVLYCQSHNPSSFGQAIGSKLRPRSA
jgi:uncharacterized protein (TIGR00266 family)